MAVRSGLQSGELSAAGCVAPLRESLDADNFEGKAHQDRRKGCDSCPKGHLPDGRGGGAARVVPDDFGTDWAAEIGNRDVRMKAEHGKTTATTEVVSSPPGENRHWSQKCSRNT